MKIFITKNKEKLFSVGIWIFIWQMFSISIDNKVLLPRPVNVAHSLFYLIEEEYFWKSIFNSVLKIGIGFLLGILFGLVFAVISYKYNKFKNFIEVPIHIIKSIPIASVVILLLIWFSSKNLPILIVLLIVLPNIYHSSLEGLNNINKDILEMSKIFNVKKIKQIKYVYFEGLKGSLVSSLLISSGLAWKSGISAEILGLVKNSIGENIYYSKLYLDTSELFAWTFIIIFLSRIFYLIFEILIRKVND